MKPAASLPVIALAYCTFLFLPASAAEVRLAWDRSPDDKVIGYKIYQGPDETSYAETHDVGDCTSTVLGNLAEGQIYTFAATAYDAHGIESPHSNAVTIRTAVTPVPESQYLTLDEDTSATVTLSASLPGISDPSLEPPLSFQIDASQLQGILSGTPPSLTYTPPPHFNGEDGFVFSASHRGLTSIPVQVRFAVLPVNDPPFAFAQEVALDEDSVLTITFHGQDPDGDPTSYVIINPPTKGNLRGTPPHLEYVPFPDVNGSDLFEFAAFDGQVQSSPAPFSINIRPVNDTPNATPASWNLTQGDSFPFSLLAEDTDGDALLFLIESSVANGSLSGEPPNLIYIPHPNFSGSDSFHFAVTDPDGARDSATVTFNVAPKYSAPTAFPQEINLDEDSPTPVVLAGFHPDTTKPTYRIVRSPTRGRLSGTAPNLTYSPNANLNGPDSFEFTVQNGTTISEPSVVQLNVLPVNDAPYGRARTASATEDRTLGIGLFTKDADGDTLTIRIVDPPANGYFSSTAGTTYYYRGHSDFFGSDRFTYTVSDGLLESPAYEVAITVKSVNDRPVAFAQSVSAPLNLTTAIELKGYDVEKDPLTFSISRSPTKGTLSGLTPNLVYTPFKTAKGTDSFRFRTHDGTLASTEATVSITIAPPAYSPVSQPDRLIVLAGASTSVLLSGESSLLANDQSDPSVATLVTPPTHGSVTLQPDGSFTYHHFGGSLASDSFSYQASNAAGDSDVTTVDVHVLGVTALRPDTSANALDFPVLQGLSYRVEYQDLALQSSGLWALLTEFTADANGIATVSDTGAHLTSQRFYRISCFGLHGQLVTEPWTLTSLALSTHPTSPSHAFEGSLVRRSTVLATAPNALQLQGPLPPQGSLDPLHGFATHLVKVVQSSSPDTLGRSWRIAGQSENSFALLTGTTDLTSLLLPGDVVEIRRLATLADLLFYSRIADGDVFAVTSAHSSPWTAEWVAGSGFWVTADGEQTGPHHASELTLLPTQSLAAHTANLQPLTVHLAGPAPIPAARP
jgi:hypothetical protein